MCWCASFLVYIASTCANEPLYIAFWECIYFDYIILSMTNLSGILVAVQKSPECLQVRCQCPSEQTLPKSPQALDRVPRCKCSLARALDFLGSCSVLVIVRCLNNVGQHNHVVMKTRFSILFPRLSICRDLTYKYIACLSALPWYHSPARMHSAVQPCQAQEAGCSYSLLEGFSNLEAIFQGCSALRRRGSTADPLSAGSLC